MYDCFNMAYQDNALQLRIKINSENLTPIPQKYHPAGSLRIPADPSWPKIPQRKLVDDVDNHTIEPPCIVTLTGTPRRSRTVVQTPLNQSPKSTATRDSAYSSFHHQKTISSMHTFKRIPGYIDPRFKKVTNVKRNQVTSTDSLQKKIDKSENTTSTDHLLREGIEKRAGNFNVQTSVDEAEKRNHEEHKIELTQTSIENNKSNNKEVHLENNIRNEIIEKGACVKNTRSSEFVNQKSMVNDADTQVDIASIPVQENNGQLFFVLDKKLQSHPLNAIHVDTITVPQEYVNQCYNVQVPVLTYKNIPMQVPPAGTSNVTQKQGTNQMSEYKNLNETFSAVRKEDLKQPVHSNNMHNMNGATETVAERRTAAGLLQNNVVEESKKSFKQESLQNPIPEKLQQKQPESSDSEYCVPNINKRAMYNNVLQRLRMKKFTCNTSGEETTDSEFVARKTIQKKDFTDANKLPAKDNKISINNMHGDIKNSGQSRGQMNLSCKETEYLQSVPQSNITVQDQSLLYQSYKTGVYEAKGRNKSEQNLPCTKSECTRKLCRNSEPYITFKQKKASAKFSRKARSYFQKNSHSALVDSDYTLAWPNCQYSRYKRNQANVHKFSSHKVKKVSQHFNPVPVHEQNITAQVDNRNFENDYEEPHEELSKSLSKTRLQREHCKCEISPRSNTDDICERPKGIPLKTQELLNKSYWEYYNKLKHKIKNTNSIDHQYPYHLTMDSLNKKGKANEPYDKELRNKVNPELQTLQQCTALSTMINKALDSDIVQTKELYMNDNMKSLSNHKIGVKNIISKKTSHPIADEPPVINSNVRCKGDKTNDKPFLELKSIIFFGGMMYILIIFLPMLYDYFYYEEYDDYKNLTYLELIVEYILSSFREAFGGVFNGVKQIFFYPHACKKCTNIA